MPRRMVVLLISLTLIGVDLRADSPNERGDRSRMFAPPKKPKLPTTRNHAWITNPIDAFVLAKLEAIGLSPSARSDKLTLLRRVTVDLTGLPPTVAEQDAFVNDTGADAYRRAVDDLLASPRYGERWSQHWLDLVRYAETDGFKADDLRPDAFRYRDFVIQALNDDMPYDQFVRLQLAGDELEPDNPQAIVATGFNRLGPDEYNAANLEQRHQEILDDVTDVTGLAFLGLTFGCARCHDHKFDPILQTDYFRLQAFFAAMWPRDDVILATGQQRALHQDQNAAWRAATAPLRSEMERLTREKRQELRKYALEKFRPEIQQAVLTPPNVRTPYQKQIARMAEQQMNRAEKDAPAKLSGEPKKLYQDLERRLALIKPKAPAPLPVAMALTDLGRNAPPTRRLAGGDWRKPREELEPGFPSFLPPAVPDTSLPNARDDSGRRAALARWITRKDNPMTARVMVNRLWQHHFGQGIVGTANDFGAQGDTATHPELLDWLAVELMEHGWSLKHMHRLMLTSATYCQCSRIDPDGRVTGKALSEDRDNKLLWHARRHRLEGEALRDALLFVSGDLNERMFGPSCRPQLPDGISNYAWKPDAGITEQRRRSIYVFAKRNMRFPMFDAFDLPDMHNSCARRSQSTTAPQALVLLNNDDVLRNARSWSCRLVGAHPSDDRLLVDEACRSAWGRHANETEINLCLTFLRQQTDLRRDAVNTRELAAGTAVRAQAVAAFCHALFNTNEFLYVD
jgi:hypothetical protein